MSDISRRDYFRGHAMAGLLRPRQGLFADDIAEIVDRTKRMADAMIAAEPEVNPGQHNSDLARERHTESDTRAEVSGLRLQNQTLRQHIAEARLAHDRRIWELSTELDEMRKALGSEQERFIAAQARSKALIEQTADLERQLAARDLGALLKQCHECKSCPSRKTALEFCISINQDDGDTVYRVDCAACAYRGNESETAAGAVANWNEVNK